MSVNSENNGEVVMGRKAEIIDDFVNSLEKNVQFRGAVLVEENGSTILRKGYGAANKTTKNTYSTVFQIGSLTKQFTAAAILKLCEMGKINLNDPINTYISDKVERSLFNFFDKWKNITIGNLLSHTSGIPNYTEREDYDVVCKHITVDDILKWARDQKLNFTPGSEFEYCNTGYTLLGIVIEKQSGISYGEFLKQHIFLPAGMHDTGVYDQTYTPSPLAATGYCFDDSGERLIEDHSENIVATFSDGSVYSTVTDLAKWSKILDSEDSILTKHSFDLMKTPGLGEYGCGLMIDHVLKQRRVHHNGSIAGFNCEFCKYPNNRNLIIVLGNNAGFDSEYLTGCIARLLFGEIEEIPKCIPFPRDFDFSPYIGNFQSEEDEDTDYEFYLENDRLFIDDTPPHQCVLLSNECLLNASEGQEIDYNDEDDCIEIYDGYDEQIDSLVMDDESDDE